MHTGVSYIQRAPQHDKVDADRKAIARRAAALLVRLVSIIILLAYASTSFLFICAWRPEEDVTALSLRALRECTVNLHSKRFPGTDHAEYEVIVSDPSLLDFAGIHEVVKNFISSIGTPSSSTAAPATPPTTTPRNLRGGAGLGHPGPASSSSSPPRLLPISEIRNGSTHTDPHDVATSTRSH